MRLREIILTLAEGPNYLVGKPRTVPSWQKAQKILWGFKYQCHPQPGDGYYKADYQVVFEDDSVVTGRYDIDAECDCDLRVQVKRDLLFASGEGRPEHWDEQAYLNFLARIPKFSENMRKLLAKAKEEFDGV